MAAPLIDYFSPLHLAVHFLRHNSLWLRLWAAVGGISVIPLTRKDYFFSLQQNLFHFQILDLVQFIFL
jgi:hypothetical protein